MPCFDCLPPVLVFWLCPWPKPGLIRRVMFRAGGAAAELVDHVGRAAVDVDALLDAQIERGGVEQVGRVDDRRGIAGGGEAGRQGAADFARADGVHQRPLAADQIENRQIGARFLGVADYVEGRQVGDPTANHRGVVDERRRAELPGQFRDRDAGDFSAEVGHSSGHRLAGGLVRRAEGGICRHFAACKHAG